MELMHPELRRGLAEDHACVLSRDVTRSPSPGLMRRFVAWFASRNGGDQGSSASLTSLSASSLCSRRTAM